MKSQDTDQAGRQAKGDLATVRVFEYIGSDPTDGCPDPPVWMEHSCPPPEVADLLVQISGSEVGRAVELPGLLRELADILEGKSR